MNTDTTLPTLYADLCDAITRIRAERDKLSGYYHEIVSEVGHDCVLKELRQARTELAALREDKADLDWLQCDPQNRFVRAVSTWMKPGVITIRDAIRAERKADNV